MRRFSVVAMLVLWGCLVSFPAAQAQTVIKIGHVLNADHVWHTCLTGFADEVGKATQGRVAVRIYPGSQLGNEKDMIEGMTLQTVDGGLIGGGSFQSIEPKFGIEALPYAWPTHEAAYRALDGELGALLLKALANKGIVGLAWWENGFRHITNNKRPIVKPEDLKGLKIRVTPDKMRLDTFKTLGASPVPINFGELYTALQQGVVDGQENPLANIHSSKLYEVNRFISLSAHKWECSPVLVSRIARARLSDADWRLLVDAMKEAEAMNRRIMVESDTKLLAEFKANPNVAVNETNQAAFRAATSGVLDAWERRPFGEFVREVRRAATA